MAVAQWPARESVLGSAPASRGVTVQPGHHSQPSHSPGETPGAQGPPKVSDRGRRKVPEACQAHIPSSYVASASGTFLGFKSQEQEGNQRNADIQS